MATPLLATDRIELTYQVLGRTHKLRHYVGGVTGDDFGVHSILAVDGTSLLFSQAAQGMWDAARKLFNATIPVPIVTLQHFDTGAWLPVESKIPTGTGTAAGSFSVAQEISLIMRDTSNGRVRVNWLETVFGYVGHSPSGFGVIDDEVVRAYVQYPDTTVVHPPGFWMKSRGDHYMASSFPCRGLTLSLNYKVKRSAHVE